MMVQVLAFLLLLFMQNFFVCGLVIFSLWTWEDKIKKDFILLLFSVPAAIDFFVTPLSAVGINGLLLLIIFAFCNRHLSPWGYPLIFMGGFSNNLVMFMNGGKMPALQYNLEKTLFAATYVQMNENTHLNILADWIPVMQGSYASIGDIIALVGIFALISELRRYRKKKK